MSTGVEDTCEAHLPALLPVIQWSAWDFLVLNNADYCGTNPIRSPRARVC